MKNTKKYGALFLAAVILMGAAGCATAKAAGLMDGISPKSASSRPADDAFIGSMADFSVALFKQSVSEMMTRQQNILVSPLSVTLALAMTANGADGETLAQMETLLGGGIPLAALNEYLLGYAGKLPSGDKSKLSLANAVWFRDTSELRVKPDFLQKNADYYGAAAYKSAFDAGTVKEINGWVKDNTGGLITEILRDIDKADMLYLINTVLFDAEWQSVYYKENVRKDGFTGNGGKVSNVDFMHSNEYLYLEDELAAGFIKPYVGGAYSFAALLPNEGVSVEDYIQSLTGGAFLDIIGNAQETLVYASMPKFQYDCSLEMNDTLKALGIPDAFAAEKADFSKMADYPGGLYISQVLHKTFISVDELGTKAGAATMVAMAGAGAPMEPKTVRLDRPFVCAIIDNATNLPLFLGAVITV
ncbi:MAG: serpin family protein [Oscillospiraceae bacterium]|jgi:serpin B|nr:serpin family protein [Oscillospiraceae bacterium]